MNADLLKITLISNCFAGNKITAVTIEIQSKCNEFQEEKRENIHYFASI